MRVFRLVLLLIIPMLLSPSVIAAGPDVLIYRSAESFPEAMAELQRAIADQGLVVSRIQRVDYGLRRRGYDTGNYQVVFYGRPIEIKTLAESHPSLIPFLPLKITIYEDVQTEETVLVAINPSKLSNLYKAADLKVPFNRWEAELRVILDTATRDNDRMTELHSGTQAP